LSANRIYGHQFSAFLFRDSMDSILVLEENRGPSWWALVTLRSRRVVGGETYDLAKFGGVVIARADNDQVQSLIDIRGKIVAAVSISGLGSRQMQFHEMKQTGLSHFTDLKQLVFTSDQGKIVTGVLNGDFDVGFISADQLERSKDEDGKLLDPSLFKIIDPKPNLEIDGVQFPFQSSTPLYPEWNLAAQKNVEETITKQVQVAMLEIEDRAMHYRELLTCREELNNTRECDELLMEQLETNDWETFNTSIAEGKLAAITMTNGKYSGWRTSLSYMQLRSMQEATGFIVREEGTNIWRCVRTSELYESITGPRGYNKKSREEIDTGCSDAGLFCGEEFTCICSPCIKPLECQNNHVQIGESCVSYTILMAAILLHILAIAILALWAYLKHKKKQADAAWLVSPKELEFGNPPQVLGEGTFGRVLQAEYSGTKGKKMKTTPSCFFSF
jgi:ABC transporter, phosphonate, periplasmic substrate-binding protein